jgi:TPR repeat protein
MPHSGRSILLSAGLLLGSASISVAAPFNCSDVVPHSDAYDSGDYGAAFKEVNPISNERCAEAEHLLGVMYAKGQGVQPDIVHAYALLLLAYSDGMSPVGKITLIPGVGDDDSELEIVQFGAQLIIDQIDQAESLAMKLAGRRVVAECPIGANPGGATTDADILCRLRSNPGALRPFRGRRRAAQALRAMCSSPRNLSSESTLRSYGLHGD